MRIWGHSQNLNKGGSMWKHGRAWLHVGKRLTINPYWSMGGRWCFAHINIGGGAGGHDLEFGVGLPWVGFFALTFENLLSDRFVDGKMVDSNLRPGEKFFWPIERQIGFSIGGGRLRISVWQNPNEGSRDDPWWWSFSWNPANTFLGRRKYSERIIQPAQSAVVSLPEGDYPVTVELKEASWKRTRWHVVERVLRAEVECGENGIPYHAGKGENDWDMEDEALFATTLPARTVEEAVTAVRDSILRGRKRYGEPDYDF